MASSYLSRTFASAGNRRTWTFSCWLKRGAPLSSASNIIFGNYTSASLNGQYYFRNDDTLQFYNENTSVATTYKTPSNLFRDTSAWYHVVFRCDTTDATASNRYRHYFNGELFNSTFAENLAPSQNYDTEINKAVTHYIGQNGNSGQYFNGSMANIIFCDGYSYDASYFGETDATTGIWKPKAFAGSYGTNGFFLKFENSGSLGLDSSGNGNNFTVNGTPTQTVDTPSNVFCTLNPLDGLPSGSGGGATVTYSNGNTRSDSRYGAGEYPLCRGNMAVNKGKWYWEAKVDTTGIGVGAGVRSETANGGDFRGGETFYGAGFSGHDSGTGFDKYDNSGSITMATDVSNGGGVIGYALNLDTGTFAIYYNGTLQGTDTTLPSNNSVYFYPVAGGTNSGGNSWSPISFNFGNGYFATTAISSPYSDGAGLGKFQYQPPTGYYALCTKNINVYG